MTILPRALGLRVLLPVCLLLAAGAATTPSIPATAPATRPSIREAQRMLYHLASPEMEGRGVDTQGIHRAAAFIADEMKHSGLKPAEGLEGYFQDFEMAVARAVDPTTTLKVSGREVKLNTEYAPLSFSAEKELAGPVVFAGYGISSAAFKYDDYAGLDVRGKVVLAMRYEPHDQDGKSRFAKEDWSEEATLGRKAEAAAGHGAAALLLVTPPEHHRGDTGLLPFARQMRGQVSTIPVIQVTAAVAEAMLKRGAGKSLEELQRQIDRAVAPASTELKSDGAPVRVEGQVVLQRTRRQGKNVVGVLPGKGPMAEEFIVVGAHYDHLGKGGPGSLLPKSNEIHHGADDNASGTTAMLRVARRLAESNPPPRSVLFVAFSGEESGLLGSSHFVKHPPVPLAKMAAMVNMDMVGRVRGNVLYVGGGGTAKEFEAVLKAADDASPLHLKDIGKGGYGPSDHMAFALKKVPVLFLFSGVHSDYHRPSDTADKINYEGLDTVVDLCVDVVQRMAALPKPQYVDAADKQSFRMGATGGNRASLGIVPDYTEDTDAGTGVKISGTVPGSPAATAGLKEGDVIVQLGERRIATLMDLSAALAQRKPGDKVEVKVRRQQQEVSVTATLAERKG